MTIRCGWRGWRLDDAGVPVEWLQALIPVDVIGRQV
jgi:hypothetical protein